MSDPREAEFREAVADVALGIKQMKEARRAYLKDMNEQIKAQEARLNALLDRIESGQMVLEEAAK